MRTFYTTIILAFPTILIGQSFSGQSNAVNYRVPEQSVSSMAISLPIELKIRHEHSFSALSQPTFFNIGKIQTPSDELRISNTAEKNKSSATELERNVPNYFCLIIGINDYNFNNERLQDLSKAVSDATTLNNTLTKEFNFKAENSILLENPSRQQIIQALENLASKITPEDNVLIFYAGHGVWDEKIKIGYWLPRDAKSDDKSSWISNSTIRDYVAGINSKHTLLIADACFSGSILKTRQINLSDIGMSNLYRLPSRKAMTSGTLTAVPDESKFMHFLLKRLNDVEGKYISARQLFFGLETAVLNNTSTVPQFGVIQDTGDEGGDFIFIRK